tara:strand:- start:350 stop:613 length:264 start_codon:yes stop_codon:yes gene_type:complete
MISSTTTTVRKLVKMAHTCNTPTDGKRSPPLYVPYVQALFDTCNQHDTINSRQAGKDSKEIASRNDSADCYQILRDVLVEWVIHGTG